MRLLKGIVIAGAANSFAESAPEGDSSRLRLRLTGNPPRVTPMTTTTTTTLPDMVRELTLELCQRITEHPEFQDVQSRVGEFMEDASAQEIFQNLTEKRRELQQKHAAGMEISEAENSEFEALRDQFVANNRATRFMEAQQMVHEVQDAALKSISKTYELGRVPTAEEMDSCCNDEGCGCKE